VRSPRLVLVAVAAACGAAGCASTTTLVSPPRGRGAAEESPRSPGAEPAPARTLAAGPAAVKNAGSPAVAWVGERAVTERDLLEAMLFFYRREYYDALNQAVNGVVVDLEALRLGVEVDPRDVTRAAEDEMERLEREVLVEFGGGVSVEAYVKDQYRRTIAEYRAHLLRVVRARLALERLVRFEQMRSDRVEIRKIVVDDRAKAEEIVAKLAAGADFAILAENESSAPSARDGGRLPPVPRGVLHPDLEAAAFSLEVGESSGVVETRDGGRSLYHVVKAVRRLPARSGPYATVREEIESGLEAAPLTAAEVAYWNEAMTRRYGIRFAD